MTMQFSSASFVAGVLTGVLLAGAWFAASPADLFSLSSALNLSSTTPSKALAEPSTAVSVLDQPAGATVMVRKVDVPVPVWVAVRELSGRELGNVLGAAKVGTPRENISVPLLRNTVSGRTYAVELYRDDGGGAFDPARFSVYVDFDTGSRVVSYFNTTYDANY